MAVFLTNQKKLAASVGISEVHMTQLKKGLNGISDSLAEKLETITGISRITWASAGRKSSQLSISLKKFFRLEKIREIDALQRMSEQ